MIRELTKEKIDALRKESETGPDLVMKLYREVVPAWDQLQAGELGSRFKFPIVSKETWTYICDQLMALSPGSGFLWINKGFSSDQSKRLPAWLVLIDNGLAKI